MLRVPPTTCGPGQRALLFYCYYAVVIALSRTLQFRRSFVLLRTLLSVHTLLNKIARRYLSSFFFHFQIKGDRGGGSTLVRLAPVSSELSNQGHV